MADYFPLMRRIVADLAEGTPEARQSLYNIARAALLTQLRLGKYSSRTEAEIGTERMAMEEAIRKVETDVAGKSPASVKAFLGRLSRVEPTIDIDLLKDVEIEIRKQEWSARRRGVLFRLADAASPQPSISADGLLDAGPNQVFDIPAYDDDLTTLPIRQRALIRVIISDLPANAPKYVKSCLRSYSDELKARGAQPILGLLQDMAGIIDAAFAAPDAEDEWLSPGIRQAIRTFADNHEMFVRHFPLDPQREELYAKTAVDEDKATGRILAEPFEKVTEASSAAHKAGIATADFLAVMEKMTEFAQVLSSAPPRSVRTPKKSNDDRRKRLPTPKVVVTDADRIQPVSVKKRTILSALGFFERAYNLVGTSAQLVGPPEGNVILQTLRAAVEKLSAFLTPNS